MYTFIIILILIACVLMILTVLAQNPKSGMAANFGASNAVMGVRQTADFLEKFTWGLAIAIVVLSLAATMSIPKGDIDASRSRLESVIEQSATGTQSFETLPMLPTAEEAAAPAESSEAAE
ncbi:MAG: preprotein translocase subunit SecG [Rikenellaceae bacterium]|jgi:preprotein translocase subunit SecG|nr:preprotein translocase subunit SecG [Rikenellaceae bacterium]